MVDAALTGAGLERVAELAAAQIGRRVVIVAPPAEPPTGVEVVVPIMSGGEALGSVAMFHGEHPAAAETSEILHLAAIASLTALALEEAREQAAVRLGAGLIDELRTGDVEGAEIARRAARLGCDLVRGAVVLVMETGASRPRQAMALLASEYPGSISELVEERVYAVLPARGGDEAPEMTVNAAAGLAGRLRRYGKTGISSFYADPTELRRAIQEAELVLEVVSRDERLAEQLASGMGSGVYRLLFRALASHPEEVRSFYEDTVAPIVRYDQQYHTELLATLESYLANDCNMNGTARSIYAHRHTVAYRLQRVKELTQLDPMISEDRERLSLGLKAYRIVAPTLPR
jgi:PucR family transcriptional regulator, purine catabolism regulatory protein